MKLLVTGREGQLARSLTERAAGRPDLDLVCIGRPEVNLEAPGSVASAIRAIGPDVVINTAAYTSVDEAEDEPEQALRVNAGAAGEAAAAAREIGAPIIQLSTDYVFDGRSREPYREDDPTGPLGVYGASKLAGEKQVRAENADHLILRTAWVYSPFGRNFVSTMMRLAVERDQVAVVDDQLGSPTSALDLAEALLRVVEEWRHGKRTGLGATYHLTNSGVATRAHFARAIFAECRRLGLPTAEVKPMLTKDWPTRALRPLNSVLSSGLFERDFGYCMPNWRESLQKVVRRIASSPCRPPPKAITPAAP